MSSGLTSNIDQILSLTARLAWLLFIIYAIIFFIRTIIKHGFVLALIRLFSFRVLMPLALVIGLGLLSLAVVFVEPPQVGVVVSAVSPGGLRPQSLRGGLHLIIPLLEEAKLYPVYWQTYTMSSKPEEGEQLGDDSIRARTSDGQEVRLDCSVIFRINIDQVVLLHIDWQDRYIQDLIRPVVRGVVRTQVSQFTVEEVNSSARKNLESTLDRLLREAFADKGIILDQFLLRDISFTPEYAASVEQKQVALEGQLQKQYEAEQLRRLARGKADAIEIEAEAQANALRLIGQSLEENRDLVTYHYVEKLSPGIRVMLVPSNNPLILPLPSLDETTPLTGTSSLTVTISPESSPPAAITTE